ncbi:response regulator transcription factor [Alloscardovia sp. HMSC034E08]|uniref:response regulator transcription factor n=1 Tax=Alloscardovia sp. HMSC034E08 TaxID=1739413 RepID=UPI0008B072DD|nr:response regulator transcription factor [Alloscardovia sp. HMSC034E08]OFQ99422.1 DNA-binding response regulator [Alloscardovia sp. HMSC034E08]
MIYYVDDDTNIRDLALYSLRQSGLSAEGFENATDFRAACERERPELILLDIMLPGEDGLSILASVRSRADLADVPVMMLTAKGSEYDKVVGLDAGADDYLAKPFGMMELVSRCNALLRRAARGAGAGSDANADLIECGPIRMLIDSHEASVHNTALDLTPKEFAVLAVLAEHPGHVFTRPQLLEQVWGFSYCGETRTVDTHMQTLRRKLNEAADGAGDLIQTVRGLGYRVARAK